MGICRDTNGKLAYTMTVPVSNSWSDVYSVTKGENRIIKHMPYIRTDAFLRSDNGRWYEIAPFDSFIKAVLYMKEHKRELI